MATIVTIGKKSKKTPVNEVLFTLTYDSDGVLDTVVKEVSGGVELSAIDRDCACFAKNISRLADVRSAAVFGSFANTYTIKSMVKKS